MTQLTLSLPAMYGDHHVTEVRRILLALPGIRRVYASSCFQLVEVDYDPEAVTEAAITAALEEAGYLQAPEIPAELDQAPYGRDDDTAFFRHTAAYQQTHRVVGFAQQTPKPARPLWPCPGIGVVRRTNEEE